MTYLKIFLVSFLVLVLNGPASALVPPLAPVSGSSGADGALDFSSTAPGTIIDFDPTTFTPAIDTDGDGVYHFTTITVPAGVTLRFRANKAGFRPIQWLASGAVIIDGILDLNGENGHAATTTGQRSPATPGSGGFPGGIGKGQNVPPQPGFGPGAGLISQHPSFGGGSAGHATLGSGFNGSGGPTYGNGFLLPLSPSLSL